MKRYIGNTGQVYIVEDNAARATHYSIPEPEAVSSDAGSILGNLFGAPAGREHRKKLALGFEIGDLAILALLFFLYRESGDDEFLIVLAFFAFGLFNK
jgi:hypothetical protein